MKKLTLTIVLMLSQFVLFAQCDGSCLPNGIIFTTQAQIDNFQINYPDCTEIEGGMEIGGNSITNIIGLNVLANIGGNLSILGNDALRLALREEMRWQSVNYIAPKFRQIALRSRPWPSSRFAMTGRETCNDSA